MFALGVFAAIYHPVGMAMLIEASQARGRTLAFNGVCGNLGAALAAGITAAIASWLGWRAAFLVPALICVATGIAYVILVTPDDRHHAAERARRCRRVPLTPRAALMMFCLSTRDLARGGLTFNTVLDRAAQDRRRAAGRRRPLLAGRLPRHGCVHVRGAGADRGRPAGRAHHGRIMLFAVVVALQLARHSVGGLLAAGCRLILALALTMAAIYGQVTVGDMVMARYTADAWRGRVYAVRYFLTFVSSGAAVSIIACCTAAAALISC